MSMLGDLLRRIGDIAKKHCSDYPDIKNINRYQQLYVIEQTLEGYELACKDLHKQIDTLFDLLNKLVIDVGKEEQITIDSSSDFVGKALDILNEIDPDGQR